MKGCREVEVWLGKSEAFAAEITGIANALQPFAVRQTSHASPVPHRSGRPASARLHSTWESARSSRRALSSRCPSMRRNCDGPLGHRGWKVQLDTIADAIMAIGDVGGKG